MQIKRQGLPAKGKGHALERGRGLEELWENNHHWDVLDKSKANGLSARGL